MTDRLIIQDVAAECRIGVSDWERETPQPLWIDLVLAVDATQAAARDDVRATIDYERLVTAVRNHVQQKTFHLLETVGEEIAALVLDEFLTTEVTVRVKKRQLLGIEYAAIELTRKRA